jgi:hypothetical protein
VVLSRRNGEPLWIAPVAQHAALLELYDRVSAQRPRALTEMPSYTQGRLSQYGGRPRSERSNGAYARRGSDVSSSALAP